MEVLLVGGLGFIGKYIIRLLAESSSLTVLSDAETVMKNQAFVKNYSLRVEVGDIQDGDRVKEVMIREKPDAVIHLAALTGLARCDKNPSLAFSINVFGTYNVIMGCVASKSKLVFISSREVYGETASDRTREEDPQVPNNLYGLTKLLGERLVLWAASRYGLDYTILRLTNVYGPGGDQYNIQVMLQKALKEGRIPILGGRQRANLICVEDVADVIAKCLVEPKASRQTFNVGSRDDMTVEEIVTRLVSSLDIPVKIDREAMRMGETMNFRPSLERIERILGWSARTTFAEGMRKTVEWYRDRVRDS